MLCLLSALSRRVGALQISIVVVVVVVVVVAVVLFLLRLSLNGVLSS